MRPAIRTALPVVALGLVLGAGVTLLPQLAVAALVCMLILWSLVRRERLVALAMVSEVLLTGLGKAHQVQIGSYSLNGSVLIDVAILCMMMACLLLDRQSMVFKQLGFFYLLFAVGLVSLAATMDPILTAKGLLKLLSYAVFYAFARWVGREERGFVRAVHVVLGLFGVTLGVAVFELFSGTSPFSGASIARAVYSSQGALMGTYSRVYSTFTHPSNFGIALVLGVCVAVGYFLVNGRKWALVFGGAMAVMAILTYSRIVWVALAVAVVVIVLSPKIRRLGTLRAVLATAAIVLLGLSGSVLVSRASVDSAVLLRVRLISEGLALYADSPLVGIGYDCFPVASSGVFGYPLEAHNDYLRVLVETGPVGALALVAFFWGNVISRVRRLARETLPTVRVLLLVTAAGLAAFGTFASTDNALQGMGLLFILVGLADGRVDALTVTKPED